MPHRRAPTSQPPPPAPLPSSYDFGRFGRHKLRTPNGAIIDLPVPLAADARVWVATIWPDPKAPGGWARQLWMPDPVTGRGWQLTGRLAAGDVLEFGADTRYGPVRWYGILDSYVVNEWTTVQGPYEHPAAAYHEAQRLLGLERYVEPLSADPPTRAEPTEPARRPRREHGRGRHHHRGGSSPI